MRVDCQTHVFPRAYAELLLQNTTSVRTVKNGDAYVVSYGDLQTFALSLDPYDPDAKIRDMDAAGIDVSVLTVSPTLPASRWTRRSSRRCMPRPNGTESRWCCIPRCPPGARSSRITR